MRLREALEGRLWRHFKEDEGGGGGGDGSFPYGPGDPPSDPGWSQGIPPPPAQPPPNNGYYTGPSRYQKPSAPAPDPWAGIAGAVHDQANALTDKFLATIGYPSGMDATQIALALAKSGTNITGSAYDAYEWLYQNKLSDSQRQSSPWAEFGMDKDTYTTTVNSLQYTMTDWTGSTLDSDTLKQAIRQSWNPTEIKNFAIYGNAQGTGDVLASAQLSGDMPWLSQGTTYTQALQGFTAFEDHAPSDRATLAAWFRFGVSAKQVGNAPEAIATPSAHSLAIGSEVR